MEHWIRVAVHVVADSESDAYDIVDRALNSESIIGPNGVRPSGIVQWDHKRRLEDERK